LKRKEAPVRRCEDWGSHCIANRIADLNATLEALAVLLEGRIDRKGETSPPDPEPPAWPEGFDQDDVKPFLNQDPYHSEHYNAYGSCAPTSANDLGTEESNGR
jgi:hypothetical protein